ncbi:MAG: RNA methyltransferase [Phycisphaerales bacterium]|nr:RNA methyltransferase [Phycisphaerales bacterium]
MRGTRVNALDDPRLGLFRDLRDRDLRAIHGAYIVESPRVVRRFLQASLDGAYEVEGVLLDEKHAEELQPLLEKLPADVPVYLAPLEMMIEISGYRFHAGALAIGRRPTFDRDLDALVACLPAHGPLTLLATDGVSNMDNVGAIIRDAAALGADGVVLGGGSSDPLLRKAIRVSMGRVFNVPWAICPHLPRALEELRAVTATHVLALENLPQAHSIETYEWPERVVIVAGSEGHGIQKDILEASDALIRIPGPDTDDIEEGPGGSDQRSLNVGVAAAIALYARQCARAAASNPRN